MNIVSKKFINPLQGAHAKELTLVFDEDSEDVVSCTLKNGEVWSSQLAAVSSLFWNVGSTILDIGTHIGTYSALAAAFTMGKVISVEPEPSNFNLLVKNKEANGFSHQICYNLAASDKDGKIDFCSSGPYSHVLEDGGKEAFTSVPARTLDSVLDGERVDFIKLDVEGWEMNVLEGLSKTIDKCSPPIVFEVNGHTLKWFDKTPNDLLRLLEERFGYQIFVLSNVLVPVSCFEPFPYGVVDCFALQNNHIPIVSKYLGLPLSFQTRNEVLAQSEQYGNNDIKQYLSWYRERMPK